MNKKKKAEKQVLLIYTIAIAFIVLVECISLMVFQFVLGFIPQFILICGTMAIANKLVKKIRNNNNE